MTNIHQLFNEVKKLNTLEQTIKDSNYKLVIGDETAIKFNAQVRTILLYKPNEEEVAGFLSELTDNILTVDEKKLYSILNDYKKNYSERNFVNFCQEIYGLIKLPVDSENAEFEKLLRKLV